MLPLARFSPNQTMGAALLVNRRVEHIRAVYTIHKSFMRLKIRNINRMSSVLSIQREPKNINRQFTVFPYYGYNTNTYFFVCKNNSIYRIESDLHNIFWVIARDMGTQMPITSIDNEILELWALENSWSNIKVIRPGIARKFQVLSVVRGNIAPGEPDSVEYNTGAYLTGDYTDDPYNPIWATNIYDAETNTVNDTLVVGRTNSTYPSSYEESLPYGTFWAINDPVVIQYEYSNVVYRRAIKNRITETTLF